MTATKAIALPTAEAIPAELRERNQWVAWTYKADGKSKLPIHAKTGNAASVSNPATWTTFDVAYRFAHARRLGIGYVFTKDDPFSGIDFDNCRDLETGKFDAWVYDAIYDLGTYAEISPSGRGIKAIARGKLPGPGANNGKIELYDHGRFFTITGLHLPETPLSIGDCTEKIDALYREHFPEKVGCEYAAPIPERIPAGQRWHALVSFAGTLRRRGLTADEMFACLQIVNQTRCDPPGEAACLRRIADGIAKYPPGQFISVYDEAPDVSGTLRPFPKSRRGCHTNIVVEVGA